MPWSDCAHGTRIRILVVAVMLLFLLDLLAFVLAELVRSPTVSRCRVQHWWQIQGRDLELVIPRIPGRVEEGWRRRILRPLYLITTSTALGSFIVSQLERASLLYYG